MAKTVLVLKGDSYSAVAEMFIGRGYKVIVDRGEHPEEVDLVVFTGGSDVSPYIYGEEPAGARGCDSRRDEYEVELYQTYKDVPKVGICRGGQLLNVLNGGQMIQDHGLVSGDVEVITVGGKFLEMRVDHHQGMLSPAEGEDLCFNPDLDDLPDYAVWYEETKSLCFQPHPEWGHKGTEDYFFELINRYFGD